MGDLISGAYLLTAIFFVIYVLSRILVWATTAISVFVLHSPRFASEEVMDRHQWKIRRKIKKRGDSTLSSPGFATSRLGLPAGYHTDAGSKENVP